MAPTPTIGDDLTRRGFARVRLWTRGVDHALFRPRAERRARSAAADLSLASAGSRWKRTSRRCSVSICPARRSSSATARRARRSSAAIPMRISSARCRARRWREVYASADVFVFPSRTDTFGIVLIEAMASGLPVAAFPVAGPIDVVGPGAGVLDEDLRAACLAGADDSARSGARIFPALHLEGKRAAVSRQHRSRRSRIATAKLSARGRGASDVGTGQANLTSPRGRAGAQRRSS